MKRYLIAAIAILCFALGVYLTNRVSGGKYMESQVAEAARTNEFIIGFFREPTIKIEQNDGPWRVQLKPDGFRCGFYSFSFTGTQTNGDFKVEWTQIPNGVEITRISQRASSQQDKLLWEKK